MAERNLSASADNPCLAERAALMMRARKRGIDRGERRGVGEAHASKGVERVRSAAGVMAVGQGGPERHAQACSPNNFLSQSANRVASVP